MSPVEQDTIDCEYLAYFLSQKIKKNKLFLLFLIKGDITIQLSSGDATIFRKKNCPWELEKPVLKGNL